MIPDINIESWNAAKNNTHLVELDWVGVDQNNQLAVFSSVGSGFIPHRVLESFERYCKLIVVVNSLPAITRATLVTSEKGDHSNWIKISKRGFFAYDNCDVHRDSKPGRYEMMTRGIPSAFLSSRP